MIFLVTVRHASRLDETDPDSCLGIFTTDGKKWHESRQLLRTQFVKTRVSDLQTFEKHCRVLISQLEELKGQTVNIATLFNRFTLDAATDFLLGESVDSLTSFDQTFSDAFVNVQHTQSIISVGGPLRKLVPRKAYHAGIKVIESLIEPFIEKALSLSPDELEKRAASDQDYTLLHALVSHTRDRKVLRDGIIVVIFAGRDSTANTLSWLFYELSRRPSLVAKLRKEIDSTIGLDAPPTYENLKQLRLLQNTVNETLRLYPVVPYNVRVSLKDTTLPRGGGADGTSPIGVPAGTPVAYQPLILQRRADVYPAPSSTFAPHLDFSPERWDNWTPKPWTYIPFNGGPRICIGQQFALTEVAYTAVRLLQRFEAIEYRMDGVPGEKADIAMQPARGLDLGFLTTEDRKTEGNGDDP